MRCSPHFPNSPWCNSSHINEKIQTLFKLLTKIGILKFLKKQFWQNMSLPFLFCSGKPKEGATNKIQTGKINWPILFISYGWYQLSSQYNWFFILGGRRSCQYNMIVCKPPLLPLFYLLVFNVWKRIIPKILPLIFIA